MEKLLVVSSDGHAGLLPQAYREYLDPQYREAFDVALPIQIERTREAAARFDDLVNWIPARLTGFLLALAALFAPGASIGRAWTAMARDARHHTSPNAGWPEAAMAGALGFALAGPRRYGDKTVDGAWMGRGRSGLNPKDIRQSLALFCWSCSGLLVASAGTAMVLRAL